MTFRNNKLIFCPGTEENRYIRSRGSEPPDKQSSRGSGGREYQRRSSRAARMAGTEKKSRGHGFLFPFFFPLFSFPPFSLFFYNLIKTMSEVIADAEAKDAPDQTTAVGPQTEPTSNVGAEVQPQTPDHEGNDGAGPGTSPLLTDQSSWKNSC